MSHPRASETTLRQSSSDEGNSGVFYDCADFEPERHSLAGDGERKHWGSQKTGQRSMSLDKSASRTRTSAVKTEIKRLKSFHFSAPFENAIFGLEAFGAASRSIAPNKHSFDDGQQHGSEKQRDLRERDINSVLPEEIMIQIFLNMHTNSKALALSALVCRRWGTILRDNGLWKGLCSIKNFSPIVNPHEFAESVHSPTQLAARKTKLRCRCISVTKRCPSSNGAEALVEGKKKCNVNWNGVSLAPWKSVYKQNLLTSMNWFTGKYTMRPLFGGMNALCLAFDENWAVLISQGEAGKLLNVKTGRLHMHLEGHTGIISAVKLHGHFLITGGVDSIIKVWDIEAKQCLLTLHGHSGEIVAVQFNLQIIASGSEDFTVRVWSTQTGEVIQELRGHTGAVCSLQIVDQLLITGSIDHSIRIWDWRKGECVSVLKGHIGYVYCLHVFGGRICSGASDGLIKIWDMSRGGCIQTLEGHESGVVCLQYDGSKIVSGSGDYTVKVWNAVTGACLYTLNHHTATVWNLNCVGSKLMTSSFDTSLVVLDFAELIPDDE
ncbi:hypothetical protein HDU77_000093 [Chytriomyces hyalinus]|nr:hypothetical protein HDU77_000093 [Chytriomyces hyalinus]